MSINRNIVASYLGNAWAVLIQIAFVPVYIKYLGIEAYGLISAYALLQVLMSLLDMGLTPTLTREMARFMAGARSVGQVRTLLGTVELFFLGLGLLIFGAVVFSAPWLAENWLKVETLRIPTIVWAFYLMGAIIILRWLVGLYRGVLTGTQRLVWLNGTNAAFDTLRGAGVVLVLLWISPTIEAFFLYQGCITLIELAVVHWKAWFFLPGQDKPRFSIVALRRIWRFSAGLTMISLLGVLMMHTDKMLLSKMLALKAFGYYALASSVAGSLNLLIGPISGVAYLRLTELVAHGNTAALAKAYHRFAQMLTLTLAPSALVLALFSDRILMLWIQDDATVVATAQLVSLLAVGAMLSGFMNIPNSLLLAYGNTTFMILLYSVFVLVFVPAVYVGVSEYGAVAAAYAWISVNACCVALAVPLMHTKLLPREQWRWYRQDVAFPGLAALAATYAVHFLAPVRTAHEHWTNLIVVALALLFAFTAATAASPLGREIVAWVWLRFSKPRK